MSEFKFMSDVIQFYCDGGCVATRGYGSYEFTVEGQKYSASRMEFGIGQTSNTSEYLALLAGLENAVHCKPETKEIHIHSDSRLLVNQINGKWRCKKKHIEPLIQRAATLLRRFKSYKVEWNSRKVNVAKFGH